MEIQVGILEWIRNKTSPLLFIVFKNQIIKKCKRRIKNLQGWKFEFETNAFTNNSLCWWCTSNQ